MELLLNNNGIVSQESKFIEANTEPVALEELAEKHIIPVFAKDNTPLISQQDFIQTTLTAAQKVYGASSEPSIRVSHPIKGRIPEARHKPAQELFENEKTIYFERMAFLSEFIDITEVIRGQELTLTVGGVKSYNDDNLYSIGGSFQKFRVFIGFQVKVCTNLSIWTDGYSGEIKVRSLDELGERISGHVQQYQSEIHLNHLRDLVNYELTEQQFATLLGRTRLYNFLTNIQRKGIPELLISDSQVTTVARQYYKDENFSGRVEEGINLWNLYNLFTDSVKSSYIDTFLDRNTNALAFLLGIRDALEGKGNYRWFLNE